MREVGSREGLPMASTPTTAASADGSSTDEDDEADDLRNQNRIGEVATARKISSGGKMNLVSPEVGNSTTTTGRVVFSSQILPTMPTAETSGSTSTKIIKTVRVRQRMRPANVPGYMSSSGQLRSRVSGGTSKVRIMTRTSAADYVRSHPEGAIPEGETLGEDDAKEVKNAHIEIKRV